jgi:hypothetical protein
LFLQICRTLMSGSNTIQPSHFLMNGHGTHSLESGGERGIRTLDGLLTHTPLAGARLRPLGHLSAHQPCGPWSQSRLRRALLRTSCTSPFGPSFIRFATDRCSKLLQAISSTTRPFLRSLTGHFHNEGHGPRKQLAKARGDPTRKARKDTGLNAIRKA